MMIFNKMFIPESHVNPGDSCSGHNLDNKQIKSLQLIEIKSRQHSFNDYKICFKNLAFSIIVLFEMIKKSQICHFMKYDLRGH